jgi:type II secretory pathway predicted ATPase ExeA
VKIAVSTLTKEYGLSERISSALDARSLVLVVDDEEQRRAEFIRDLYRTYTNKSGYLPVIVRTPVQGSDVQLMRLIAVGVGLAPVRTRFALWRNFEVYCKQKYEQGKRMLLIFEDAHLMKGEMLRLLHALSTITIENDLAVQMILIGRNDLATKLKHPSHRALWSRTGARVKLKSDLESLLDST